MQAHKLLSISEASNFLGVSEATLRAWTDEGQIKAFITPGGHRRYDSDELKRFYISRSKTLSIKDLAQEMESNSDSYKQIAHEHIRPAWFNNLSIDSYEQLIQICRDLFCLTIDFVKNPSRHKQISTSARLKGKEFGTILAGLGLSLSDSVEAFLFNRSHTIDFMTDLIQKNIAHDRRVLETLPSLTRMMDEVLLSLINAHQDYTGAAATKAGKVIQN